MAVDVDVAGVVEPLAVYVTVADTVPAAGAFGAVTLNKHDVELEAATVVAWQLEVTTVCGVAPKVTDRAVIVTGLPPAFWNEMVPAT